MEQEELLKLSDEGDDLDLASYAQRAYLEGHYVDSPDCVLHSSKLLIGGWS